MLTSFAPFVRAASPRWHRWLRRSVRLYLALEEPQVNTRLVEDQLLLTEWQLIRHIVDGEYPTPALTRQARAILEMAQATILGSDFEVKALRHEMSVQQAVCPWQRAA